MSLITKGLVRYIGLTSVSPVGRHPLSPPSPQNPRFFPPADPQWLGLTRISFNFKIFIFILPCFIKLFLREIIFQISGKTFFDIPQKLIILILPIPIIFWSYYFRSGEKSLWGINFWCKRLWCMKILKILKVFCKGGFRYCCLGISLNLL